MQDFIGSVRRSLVFKPPSEESARFGGFVDKIGSSIRKSRIGLFAKPPMHALPPIATPPRKTARPTPPMEEDQLPPMEEATEDEQPISRDMDYRIVTPKAVKEEEKKKEVAMPPPIRWRKGELIGCGAFGRVHMGMNLDSGELLAVKEVDSLTPDSLIFTSWRYNWFLLSFYVCLVQVAIGANSTSKKTQVMILFSADYCFCEIPIDSKEYLLCKYVINLLIFKF